MKLSLVGVALCCVVGLVLFGSFAWDKAVAWGMAASSSRASALKSPTTMQQRCSLSVSGELCGEGLPELVPAWLFALVVWGVHCQNAKWSLDGVDGKSKKSAVYACEISDGGCEVWGCDQVNARECLYGLAFAVVLFCGTVCDGVAIDHELVWLLDVCLCERQPAEAVLSHDVDQGV